MSPIVNDFSVTIATVNGSGSQSANNILLRSIFRTGVPVSGKNLFPSNIAGLPTWFTIRANQQGYVARKPKSDVVVAMNKETLLQDFEYLNEGGVFVYNDGLRFDKEQLPNDVKLVPIDFNKLCKQVTDSIQLKKLLVNMIYVGVLCEFLEISEETVESVINHQFKTKQKVVDINKKAVAVGREQAKEMISSVEWPWKLQGLEANQNKILMDGNTAGALGLVYGGCSFASWYPITPSSSLAESFEDYCNKFRVENGQKNFAMVQAEDELSAISMVAGAGWAGARAMTATSGPGISLMSEAIGLMYFAEVPGLIWDVQRMGPSTGLPTRTSQGDILAAARSSHGDTRHPVLLPADPKECFELAGLGLDLSERIQSPVFVLSDLDLGMNFWMSDKFEYSDQPFDRGKVLSKQDLEKLGEFARYQDKDGDGIPYRTLPGTEHDLAAYFTRGTGHTPEAKYSERSDNYQDLMNRLDRKWQTVKELVPGPEIVKQESDEIGLVYFGSTNIIIDELLELWGVQPSLMRLKAYPFNQDVEKFLSDHKKILVIEQNQHGQMVELLRGEFAQHAAKISAITNCDGMPLSPQLVSQQLQEVYNGH